MRAPISAASGVKRCMSRRLSSSFRLTALRERAAGRAGRHVDRFTRSLSTFGIRSASIIAPPVNVLRRTRRKPSTIRGASPEVVIGQSAADRAGARPYQCCLCSPPVNVLRRTRRKPSTIRGASPEVVIGQSAADRAGARPYHIKSWPESRRGEWF